MRSDALTVVNREYSNRKNEEPVGGSKPGKFWSVRIVDPAVRTDPTISAKVEELEAREEELLYEVAKVRGGGANNDPGLLKAPLLSKSKVQPNEERRSLSVSNLVL